MIPPDSLRQRGPSAGLPPLLISPLRRASAATTATAAAAIIAFAQPPASAEEGPAYPEAEPRKVPAELFSAPEGLEVTVWASSPMLHNPTNIDIDIHGRIWVAEGVRYRRHHDRRPEGDRIVVLEDTNGDGTADSSHVFVQDPMLVAPMGVAVIDNQIVVSQPPHLLVYTDVDRDLRFAPEVDTLEILLTGFNGINHDHSLHSVTVGPEGKWYFNSGNCGAKFTDRSDRTFRIFGPYRPDPIGPFEYPHDPAEHAGQPSDDGHVYVGGFLARMNPDGTDVEIIGHNFRNSYEQSVTSFGDVFHNDNDDPPACRVSWVMEYANFGFASNDGQRNWRVDRRPGQSIATAQWRQEDPGSAPAGDVYGGGSPTGNVYYENGALGDEWIGTFLACEPGRNTIFSYQPRLEGAGFLLERSDFLTSNPPVGDEDDPGRFAGSDFLGGNESVTGEEKTLFRPSDIAIGPDGALYVSDWYDARVGGHQALDDSASGTIYRIAHEGFVPEVPEIDLDTVEGAILALKSPAPNVRAVGFERLKGHGRRALQPVAELLEDPNPHIQARALFLLYQMGISGPRYAGYPPEQPTPELRIAAYRAMRHAGLDTTTSAMQLAADSHPAVRREVALSMRNESFETAGEILTLIARGFDGEDRAYLEAIGTGATGKEREVYEAIKAEIGHLDPRLWSVPFSAIAWRLHPESAVDDFVHRVKNEALPLEFRKEALDAIAFVRSRAAAEAMVNIARLETPLKADAIWWLLNRANNDWQRYDLSETLKERGIYDPANVVVQEILTPEPDPELEASVRVAGVLALEGDPERGRVVMARCIMCHEMGGLGMGVGPALDGWGTGQSDEIIAQAIVEPDADIAHGFDAAEILMKDGQRIHGILLQEGNPTIVISMGGVTQILPRGRIESVSPLGRSLMPSAAALALTEQDVADLVSYLKEN